MSKVSRDKRKAEVAGKKLQKKGASKELQKEEKEPKVKGLEPACCRCKRYKRPKDEGPKCGKTGEHVARKFLCGDFVSAAG